MKSFHAKVPAVAVFLKYPAPGLVKTRLAATLGAEKAAAIYRRMVITLLEIISGSPGYEIHIFADPHRAQADYGDCFPIKHFEFHWQHGHELGTRMRACFDELLPRYRRVILIGSDCLEVTPALLQQAADQLQHNDLVLGPATDGGYYLIGLRRAIPQLFEGIPWGEATVLQETEGTAKKGAVSYTKLIPLSDIDTEVDLRASLFQKKLLKL